MGLRRVIRTPNYGELNALRWSHEAVTRRLSPVSPWYEWWYYKAVDPGSSRAVYVAYGVVNPGDTQGALPGTCAFIAFGVPHLGVHLLRRFDRGVFSASERVAEVSIGQHRATQERVIGALEQDGHAVAWDLAFLGRWGVLAGGPAYRHHHLASALWYPAQADAECSGSVTVDGQTFIFDRAPGYQDRNWGQELPIWSFWVHANRFDDSPGSVLVCGGGLTRIAGAPPVRIACLVLRHHGRVHAFRNFQFEPVDIARHPDGWTLDARGLLHRLHVHAATDPAQVYEVEIPAPMGGGFRLEESLCGRVEVTLYRRTAFGGWVDVAQMHSQVGAVEHGAVTGVGAS